MSTNLPSFERAEYPPQEAEAEAPVAAKDGVCERCGRLLRGRFFAIEERPTCESCAEEAIRTRQSGQNAELAKSVLFGAGAALLGMMLYAGVEILTGWVIGYAAIAVGYLVGKAMKKGSGGRGGRRFQIAASVLTYAAVSMAAIPVGIHGYLKEHPSKTESAGASRATAEAEREDPAKQTGQGDGSSGYPVLRLLGVGLASPFLDLTEGVGGLIGLFILFIGIRAAWNLTAGTEVLVTGPYETARPAASFRNP